MLQERVSADIYVFTSDIYVQVTAGVVLTAEGAELIDTMPFPIEAYGIAQFIARRGKSARYVILTHYHADHTYGAFLFPHACVVAHARCRQLLEMKGEQGLAAAQAEAPDLQEVRLRFPALTLDEGEMDLCLGGKTLRLFWTPGHSEDVISVLAEDDRVLFASDTVMPVPFIVDGDLDALRASLQKLMDLQPECIVPGHGEVILRGEVQDTLQQGIRYLDTIQDVVSKAIAKGKKRESLLQVDIEKCGLSRVALNGRAPELHRANLLSLYDRMVAHAG